MKKRWIALWLVIVLALTMLIGCGGSGTTAAGSETQATLESAPEALESVSDSAYAAQTDISAATSDLQDSNTQYDIETEEPDDQAEDEASDSDGNASSNAEVDEADEESSGAEEAVYEIDEDGSYTTKEDVALYLHTYGHLPGNFMTKKEAKKLGWTGGSLEDYAPGMCIGGDYFGNYEGILPKGSYHECDIDTLGKKKRGAKRIIYSDDGRIYYTDDHYETFDLLYE